MRCGSGSQRESRCLSAIQRNTYESEARQAKHPATEKLQEPHCENEYVEKKMEKIKRKRKA